MHTAYPLPFSQKAEPPLPWQACQSGLTPSLLVVLRGNCSNSRAACTAHALLQVRIMYCEMLGHDVSFAYIPVLQMASDPNLLNKKVGQQPQVRCPPGVAVLVFMQTAGDCPSHQVDPLACNSWQTSMGCALQTASGCV